MELAHQNMKDPAVARELTKPTYRGLSLTFFRGNKTLSRGRDNADADADEMDYTEPDDECIGLLNQRIAWKEYDSAMVCAMALLGLRVLDGILSIPFWAAAPSA